MILCVADGMRRICAFFRAGHKLMGEGEDRIMAVERETEVKEQGTGNDKLLAALAYLGVLVAVPLLMDKKSKFVKFHAGQGVTLFAVEVIYSITYQLLAAMVMMVSWRFYFMVRIAGYAALVFPVLAVTGIVNAANGQEKELPVIGKIRVIR